MAKIRKAVRVVDGGIKTITLDPSGRIMAEIRRQDRQPSSIYVANKRMSSAMAKSFQGSTKTR